MWNEIKTQDQVQELMDKVLFFHDSCIKEMKYVSGAYVTDTLAMYPINDKRVLSVLIQRQFNDIPTLELQFTGVKYLKLCPNGPEFTSEILGATIILKEDSIIWCDYDNLTEDQMDEYASTVICAECMRWRIIDDEMGDRPFYESRM